MLHSIAFALPISNAKKLVPSSREHGTTAITYLYYRPGVAPSAQLALAQTYAQRIRTQGDPVTGVTGTIPAREAEFRQIEHALPYVEAATIALIALILLIAFRAIGPPLVTLGAAALSYAISVRLLTWIADGLGVQVPRRCSPCWWRSSWASRPTTPSSSSPGVKRSLASGERRVRAAEQTTRLFLPIIVTAGLIVAFGSRLADRGPARVLPRLGAGHGGDGAGDARGGGDGHPGDARDLRPGALLARLRPRARGGVVVAPAALARGDFATWRPVALVLTIGAAAVLVLGASQARSTVLGLDLLAGLPGSDQVKQAADDAGKGFAPGDRLADRASGRRPGAPRRPGRSREAAATTLRPTRHRRRDRRRLLSRARSTQPVFVSSAGNAARFAPRPRRRPARRPRDPHAAAVARVTCPACSPRPGSEARAGLAGDTALADDTVTTIHSDIARVALALLLANFVLLALFLRAVLAPLYLLAASVLALTASIGAATWVFQSLFGVPGSRLLRAVRGRGPAPVARVRLQHLRRREDLAGGREPALPRGDYARCAARLRTIAIAGVTLAGSFALLAIIPIRAMRELAFVMSVGVLIDSFLVRSVLVPSLIATFGRISWWPRRPPETQRAAPQLETLETGRIHRALGARVAWRPRERRLARGRLLPRVVQLRGDTAPAAGSTGSWADVRPTASASAPSRGRSTRGSADAVDLAGLGVVLATRYSDDE